MSNLTVRVPVELRDSDGIRLEQMLDSFGASIVRELPRTDRQPAGYVDLLVLDSSAGAHLDGALVTPEYDEVDDGVEKVLAFDRWKAWTA